MWTLGRTSPVCLKWRLWGGCRTVAVFHPLKHTRALRLAGKEGRRKEKADRRDSGRSACSRTHSSSSHPYLTEHSGNRLSFFPATFSFLFFFFPLFLLPISLVLHPLISPSDRAQTSRVRLKQRCEDTAGILGCVGIRKEPPRFHFVTVSIRTVAAEGGDFANAKAPSTKSHPWRLFFKRSRGSLAELRSSLPSFVDCVT